MSVIAEAEQKPGVQNDASASNQHSARQTRHAARTAATELPVKRDFLGRKKYPKIPRAELVNITSQLAIMLRSGVDVVSALESLARQATRDETQEILETIHGNVTEGMPFSAALAQYRQVFGASYIACVSAGEASGKMWDVLAHLAQLKRSELRLRTTLKTMTAYPVVLASISTLVIMALVFFVLPQFAKVFSDFGTPLPVITRILLGISYELSHRWWLWIPVGGGIMLGLTAFSKTEMGRSVRDHAVLNFRVLRNVTRTLMIGRICRLLGLLLESGVPLLESLTLVKDSLANKFYREVFAELEENVLCGKGLGTTLVDTEFIPSSAAEMVMTAERTGTLGSVTQLIGEHYEQEGEEKLRGLVSVLEPAITVIMGVIVAIVVLSVALPMFDLATLAK